MTSAEAVMIVHARLLGATYRRIAELFGDRRGRQLDGERLLNDAECVLGLPAGWVDLDEVETESVRVHRELGRAP